MNKKPSAINIIWLMMILIETVVAAYTGKMSELTQASFDSAKGAVTLAIGLIGPMALWLGIMKVVEAGGLMLMIARAIRPVMVRLFPAIPAEHPAMSAMIMNMAANALGLGNAATPIGIKAMEELDKLNPEKETATNAMCLFLAINTSSVTLLPLGVITVRAGANAANPASILVPAILATACSTTVAIIAAKLLARRSATPVMSASEPEARNEREEKGQSIMPDTIEGLVKPGAIGRILVLLLVLAFAGAPVYRALTGNVPPVTSMDFVMALTQWVTPILMVGFLLFGYFRGVRVYETLTEGAKEGFNVALRIIPFLVAIFVAIGMFRASGALELLTTVLEPVTALIGMPPEALPMALIRPLSGTGAFGIMSEIVSREPDSLTSFIVSIMQGSTETTFYVLAVYFGAIGIKRTRHALPAALMADAAGVLAAVWLGNLFF